LKEYVDYNNSQVKELADELKQNKDYNEWYIQPMSEVKYMIWEKYQRPKIKYAYELEYESLSSHPLWIKPELRKQFKPTQTTL